MSDGYSIREAARAAGMTEEQLRRAILTGELVARPVPDDRQYLIGAAELRRFANLPAPEPAAERRACGRPSFWRVAVAVSVLMGAILVIIQLTPRRSPAVCLDCAAVRETAGSRCTPCGAVPRSRVRKTHLTELIEQAYPGECDHEWRRPAEIDSTRCGRPLTTVAVMDQADIFTRAAEVDPGGAADLVRWALRNPMTLERLQMLPDTDFENAGAFRAWFAELRGGPVLTSEPF